MTICKSIPHDHHCGLLFLFEDRLTAPLFHQMSMDWHGYRKKQYVGFQSLCGGDQCSVLFQCDSCYRCLAAWSTSLRKRVFWARGKVTGPVMVVGHLVGLCQQEHYFVDECTTLSMASTKSVFVHFTY